MAPKHFAPVWKHFSRNLPIGRSKHHRAQCVYCKYELSGQPERMKAHLRKCKKISYKLRTSILKDYPPLPQTDIEFSDGKTDPITSTPILHHNSNTNINDNDVLFSGSASYSEKNSTIDHSTFGPEANSHHTSFNSPSIEHEYHSNHIQRINLDNSYKSRESLPGSVQGLLGLSWDRTGRSILNLPQNDQNSSYRSLSQYSQNKHPSNQTSNDSFLKKSVAPHKNSSFDNDDTHQSIKSYYSKLPSDTRKRTFITNKIAPHPIIKEAISNVPTAVREGYFGCGIPIPMGIEGLRVLDLGCGSGRDCYVVSKLVGQSGKVTGIDMVDQVIEVAQKNILEYSTFLGYRPHLNFIQGYNEFLYESGLYPESFDLCISNNAINLSPNKELVFKSVFDILREGGEFYFSDIYADRRLPNHLRSHPTLITENLGGALYIEDFKRLCQRVGFADPRQVGPAVPVRIESPSLRDLVRSTQFYSITYRMFKLTKPTTVLEPTREDYGQIAIYRGTVEGQRARLRLDNDWCFEANRAVLVDGNTAVILSETWLQRHFEVQGDRSNHFGSFASIATPASQYDAWELENDEYNFYNSLLTNNFTGGVNSSVSSNSKYPLSKVTYMPQPLTPANIDSSFGYNKNSLNNENMYSCHREYSQDRENNNKLFENSIFNIIPATDPTPTFSISTQNFTPNHKSKNQITADFRISSTADILNSNSVSKTKSVPTSENTLKSVKNLHSLAPISSFLTDCNQSSFKNQDSSKELISTENNNHSTRISENRDSINFLSNTKAKDSSNNKKSPYNDINNKITFEHNLPRNQNNYPDQNGSHRIKEDNVNISQDSDLARNQSLDQNFNLDIDLGLGLDIGYNQGISSTHRSAISSE
ncbi:hypothetical protein BB561_000235 [Smittium simulii]|uniref:Arsenite methyltransferase n=1 Tax=Smittium simulii TaxID=133385 RepID=A0A2T9YZP2_9FUNG|nr:hypothetical protein BB561_000235 [Smittium simulii]